MECCPPPPAQGVEQAALIGGVLARLGSLEAEIQEVLLQA
jgi:hypothetical protein